MRLTLRVVDFLEKTTALLLKRSRMEVRGTSREVSPVNECAEGTGASGAEVQRGAVFAHVSRVRVVADIVFADPCEAYRISIKVSN